MARLTKIILFFLIVMFSFQAQAKNQPPGTGTADIPANILIMLAKFFLSNLFTTSYAVNLLIPISIFNKFFELKEKPLLLSDS